MSRLTSHLAAAAVIGQLVGLLGWIDVLFFPVLVVAPVLTGAIAASRQVSYAWIAVLWCSAGISMLWTDWWVNQEDVLFHLATAVIMPLLAGVGWGVVRLTSRRTIRA